MIIKPKTDVVFKIMFTRKENENLLKNFIADVLDILYADITNIIVENSEITPGEIDGKFTRFDIKLMVDKRLINVEIQVNNYNDFAERSLYYWAQRYGSQLKKGDGYDKIQPTISINIVDFKMFETGDYNSVYTMADLEHNAILTDKCAIHFFELPKLDKSIDANNRKKLWMQLINSESEGDLEMLKNAEYNVPYRVDTKEEGFTRFYVPPEKNNVERAGTRQKESRSIIVYKE